MKTKHIVTPIILAAVLGIGYHYLPQNKVIDVPPTATPSVSQSSKVGPSEIYPNLSLTPGATNPNVTQDNIGQNICNPGWSTKSIRPPSTYTTALKKKQLANGYTYQGDLTTTNYEEDHLISLELGGNPTSEQNLWPESYNTTPVTARDKDKVENYLHSQVCNGSMTLQQAQYQIVNDWYSVYPKIKNTNTLGSTSDN